MKKLYTSLTVFVLSSLFFASCENIIGLGTTIKIKGPIVTILEPSPNRDANETDPNVNSLYNLTGIVRSESKTARMTVTLDFWNPNNHELVRMGREWKWENGWSMREYDAGEWNTYTEADYDPADADPARPVDPPSWDVSLNVVAWNLPLNMKRMESGDYFITVSAWDVFGNHDSNSSAKLKIKHNNREPNLRILRPPLLSSVGSMLSFPNPPDYSGYVFDPLNRPQMTYNDIGRFTNNIEEFTWEIEVPGGGIYTGSYEFSFEITNEHDLDNPADKVVYYSWEWGAPDSDLFENGLLPQYGTFQNGVIGASNGRYRIVGEEVKFHPDIKASLPEDQITPMQIVSTVKDPAGNVEYRSKGWLLYLPDSDKAFSDISFAYMERPPVPVPDTAPDGFVMNRNSINRTSVAYDDDGVARVKWTLHKLQDNSLAVDVNAVPFTGQYPPNGYFSGGNKRETWEFTADSNFGIGRFMIEVTVEDTRGADGVTQKAYFTIASNSTPTIKQFDASYDTDILWGDTKGDFQIKGIAQIEDSDECNGTVHNVRVNRVLVAWIKPNQGSANDVRYQQQNDPLWETTLARPGNTDDYGNKVWEVPQQNITFVAGTEGNNNGPNGQEDWNFALDLNLFTDLNIGKGAGQIPFSDQVFRVKVISKPFTTEFASVDQLPTLGDDRAPSMVITGIYIKNAEDVEIYYPKSTGESFGMLPAIRQNYQVKLEGTWAEESIAKWSASGKTYVDLLKDFNVTWESEKGSFTFPNCVYSANGTWSTGYRTFTENNSSPMVTLSASLKDLNDNPGIGSEIIVIETDEPTLIRINSLKPDGTYGANSEQENGLRYIEIFLEFNKNVQFFAGTLGDLNSTTAPRLILNNGGEAFYNGGNGTNRLSFRYFMDGNYGSLNTAVSGKGGTSTKNNNGDYYTLNVDSIQWNGFPQNEWKSVQGMPITFPPSVFSPTGGLLSLAGGKRFIIDNDPPVIKSITTGASNSRNHGANSQIYITVTFDKQIKVSGQTTGQNSNLYLTLKGGNLQTNNARANYSIVAGSSSISFVYTVGANDDTSNYNPVQHLGINTFVMGSGVSVTDVAGNPFSGFVPNSGILHNSSGTQQNIVIDTNRPPAPTVGTITARSYYGDAQFTINGLEPNATVEYYLNYPASGPEPPTGWTTYTGTINNNGSTNPITISLNGEYNIAARQYDNASTTQNRSDTSARVGPVRVDKGALLTRLASAGTPDGAYSYGVAGKNRITIDMEFRIPLTLAGGTAANAYLELNTGLTGADNRATLSSATGGSPAGTIWTFEYTIPNGASAEPLKVTDINLNAVTINDQNNFRVNGANGWINFNDLESSKLFENQKNITILTGRPQVANRALGGDIQFTGTQLTLKFDRDIYRGSAKNKLIIRQIAGAAQTDFYRIPAVLSENQFNDFFSGRDEIFEEQTDILDAIWSGSSAAVKATNFYNLGVALYQKGTNGANLTGNNLESDTTAKYVLKFDVDPTAANNSVAGLAGTNLNMGQIRELFRAAEALSFGAYDKEVSIENVQVTINGSVVNKPRQLKIDLSEITLPVKGARYQWIFPNGFVKDVLGQANGSGAGSNDNPTGNDADLTSGNTTAGARVLFHSNTTVETPVIRIDKGSDIETFNNATANRQALQPLTSRVKINSRTPGAAVVYWSRQTMDNASRLIMRADPTNTGQQLPNRNNFTAATFNSVSAADRKDYFDNTRMRPQSGTAGYPVPEGYGINENTWRNSGQNWWTAMGTAWGNQNNYSQDFTIGTNNYSDGGMIIHIRARATATGVTQSDYGYESAYRSVFVYVNQDVNGNGTNNGRTANGVPYGANLNGNALDRIWIRGSDNTYGNPTAPDFPISMDPSKWRKIRLLTPINAPNGFSQATTLTEGNIPTGAVGTGPYLWFWVTWKINVPAFLHVYYGQLPAAANDEYQTPASTREITLGSVGSLEHFPVFPGRTTAVETRNDLYANRWYGNSGNLEQGVVVPVPARSEPD